MLRLSKEKNAVKIYYVKVDTTRLSLLYHDSLMWMEQEGKIPGGLGVARVAEVEINAPIDQVRRVLAFISVAQIPVN